MKVNIQKSRVLHEPWPFCLGFKSLAKYESAPFGSASCLKSVLLGLFTKHLLTWARTYVLMCNLVDAILHPLNN